MAANFAVRLLSPRGALMSVLALGIVAARTQSPPAIPGYGAANAGVERRTEADAIALPSPTNAAEYSRALSREPHMSGTPAQARTRDYVIDRMRSWGLETEVRAYEVW